jgi:hypothetical protein
MEQLYLLFSRHACTMNMKVARSPEMLVTEYQVHSSKTPGCGIYNLRHSLRATKCPV